MSLANEFYDNFRHYLGHYHLSGFAGENLDHTTLHTTRQDVIISHIKTNHPVIIESFGIQDISDFRTELNYITHKLTV